LDKRVSSESLLSLLEAARWAPSGGNKQPWLIVVVQESDNIQKIKMFSPGLSGDPPVLFFLCDDKTVEGGTHLMDIAMAAQNILLTAREQGLGSCPIRSFNQRAVQMLLDLPTHVTPQLLISLGYPEGPINIPPRRAIEQMVHWERYGGQPGE
jgi:nitroreductase